MTVDNARIIHEMMIAHGFVRDRSCTTGLLFRGDLNVDSKSVVAEILFQDSTLTKLPKLRLPQLGTDLSSIAHIEHDGRVCYAQEIELQLDPLRPEQSVNWVLDAMKAALRDMHNKDQRGDILNEFPQHWLGELDVHVTDQWTKSGDGFVYKIPRHDRPIHILSRDDEGLHRLGVNSAQFDEVKKSGRKVRVVFTSKALGFAVGDKQPETLQELIRWASNQEFDLDQKIVNGLADQRPDALAVFIAASNGIVGALGRMPSHLANAKQTSGFTKYLIQHHAHQIPITRVTGLRADEEFVLNRNLGGNPSLAGRKIALLGIGTIGGALAKLLVQSGAGFKNGLLALVDEQDFLAGNVGRHLVGLESVGRSKASAVRDDLVNRYRGARILALPENFLSNLEHLLEYDLVIDATGDYPVSAYLNSFMRGSGSGARPEVLYVWLEGNGVAARALLASTQFGCRNCLKTLDSKERFPLLRPEHPAAVTPANCGEGAYFAYGPGSSAIAAGLAAQMALDWAADRKTPRLRSIRIVEEATFSTKNQDPPKLVGCAVCGGVKS